MATTLRILDADALGRARQSGEARQEWLVTNGLGGYAAGTVDGVFTRRYHGLLIAALAEGRIMMLNGLAERIRLPDRSVWYLGAEQLTGVAHEKILLPTEFRLDRGLPVWQYRVQGFLLEKRLLLPYRQNTVHVLYDLLEAEGTVRIGARPALQFRGHDVAVSAPLSARYSVLIKDEGCEIQPREEDRVLRLRFAGPRWAFTSEPKFVREILFPLEEERGYEFSGEVWSPGYFRADLEVGTSASLSATVENWEDLLAVEPAQGWAAECQRRDTLLARASDYVRDEFGSSLVLAADAFLMTPRSRTAEAALARAEGAEAWSVIAGYHWFTDWGRDTMISLEGLTLCTGRHQEARWILRSFARHIRHGLIPNLFPEGAETGLYHTADATLWFFHALSRYVAVTGDQTIISELLPSLIEVFDRHVEGTLFGIRVDPQDGLLIQGQEGYQLTWMDAKVGDWVVTPRRGKAVEINALWYNALRLLENWLEASNPGRAKTVRKHADRTQTSFNQRFYMPERGYLRDVIDGPNGDEVACRPNQILSLSLSHPVLNPALWESVLQTVESKLLTPMGLRTLSPDHPDYKPVYFGDLRARDAAYHQGTVWPWLLGPYIDAYDKVYPERTDHLRLLLQSFANHLGEACIGSISEIFDGDAPYKPRGCVAQAWSVAEVLRCWILCNQPD
jgi:predicted glycogen debranching enzyme